MKWRCAKASREHWCNFDFIFYSFSLGFFVIREFYSITLSTNVKTREKMRWLVRAREWESKEWRESRWREDRKLEYTTAIKCKVGKRVLSLFQLWLHFRFLLFLHVSLLCIQSQIYVYICTYKWADEHMHVDSSFFFFFLYRHVCDIPEKTKMKRNKKKTHNFALL